MANSTNKYPGRSRTSRKRKWSGDVTKNSHALDLESGIFKSKDPKKIASSLKRSAEHSRRKKTSAFQSAMSMLNFYANRAGKNIPASEKKVLQRAKSALRKIYGRVPFSKKKLEGGES